MKDQNAYQEALLCNTKGTEYESNSQQKAKPPQQQGCCCVIPKVLNMKAIHNHRSAFPATVGLLCNTKGTEYESNSQRSTIAHNFLEVVV